METIKTVLENGLFKDGDWIESKDQDPDGEIRLIQLADIGDGIFIDKSSRFINKETSKRLRCTFLQKNDILVARMPDPLGRACIFPLEGKEKYVTAVDVCIMRVGEKNHNKYLMYAINNPILRQDIARQSTGTTRKRITRKKLGELQIPLPPLSTQKKIAAILDEADRLRQLNQQVLDKYDALGQSIFLDMFGDPILNTKNWNLSLLKKCCSKIGSGATPRGGKEAYKKEGTSLIRSMNVYDNRFKYKDLAFIDEEQAYKLKNVIVEKDDILFNITGASVCRCTIVPNDILPARVNQHVAILRPKKEILNPIYLNQLIISENCKNALLGVGKQAAATREAITKDQLQNFKIPLPPIDLQTQFANQINSIEVQKSQAQAALKKSEDLFNSLLQKAFKGELVK